MGWKNLTFILIPHSQSKIKQIRISRYILIGLAVFLVVAIGIMIFYIIGFQRKSFLLSYSRDIKKQNIILEKIVADLDSSLTSLNSKIDSLETTTKTIRTEAQISDIDLKLEKGINVQFAESGLDLPLYRVLSYIGRLERRSYVFDLNFNTLYSKCEDNIDFLKHLPSIRPANGFISKEFEFLQHSDNYSMTNKSHPGVNITNDEGTPIGATANGVVILIDFSNEHGRYIEIDHRNGYKTRYTHLKEKGITVKVGDKVTRGQTIGLMGRTGSIPMKAVAPHVMYTVEHNGTYVDPTDYFFASDFANENLEETPSEQIQ